MHLLYLVSREADGTLAISLYKPRMQQCRGRSSQSCRFQGRSVAQLGGPGLREGESTSSSAFTMSFLTSYLGSGTVFLDPMSSQHVSAELFYY